MAYLMTPKEHQSDMVQEHTERFASIFSADSNKTNSNSSGYRDYQSEYKKYPVNSHQEVEVLSAVRKPDDRLPLLLDNGNKTDVPDSKLFCSPEVTNSESITDSKLLLSNAQDCETNPEHLLRLPSQRQDAIPADKALRGNNLQPIEEDLESHNAEESTQHYPDVNNIGNNRSVTVVDDNDPLEDGVVKVPQDASSSDNGAMIVNGGVLLQSIAVNMKSVNRANKTPKELAEGATVVHSVLECFKEHDVVEVPIMLEKIGRGGNGTVYRCRIKNYKGPQLLACKKEHRKLLSDNAIFHKLCQIKNNKHILPILAYLKVRCTCRNRDCSGFTGYLIMEYFPIGNVDKVADELRKQRIYTNEFLNQTENEMEKYEDINHWLQFNGPWHISRRQRERYKEATLKLMKYAIRSTEELHRYRMLHLDIKGGNFLIRKTCAHTDILDCICDEIKFDVVLNDFDYVLAEGTNIIKPQRVGTELYRALPLLDRNSVTVNAKRLYDLHSLSVMIISIICGTEQMKEQMCKWRHHIMGDTCAQECDMPEVLTCIHELESELSNLNVCKECSKSLENINRIVQRLSAARFEKVVQAIGKLANEVLISITDHEGKSNFGPPIYEVIEGLNKILQEEHSKLCKMATSLINQYDKNDLYEIILVHLTSNTASVTRKHLQVAGY